jgi:uncharacterized membrane protein YjfL (UPF0719 family)
MAMFGIKLEAFSHYFITNKVCFVVFLFLFKKSLTTSFNKL